MTGIIVHSSIAPDSLAMRTWFAVRPEMDGWRGKLALSRGRPRVRLLLVAVC
jgi:hypothetical protein